VHAYNPADPAQPTTLLSRAHDRGLKVYPYTFRNEVRRTGEHCSSHWRLMPSKPCIQHRKDLLVGTRSPWNVLAAQSRA